MSADNADTKRYKFRLNFRHHRTCSSNRCPWLPRTAREAHGLRHESALELGQLLADHKCLSSRFSRFGKFSRHLSKPTGDEIAGLVRQLFRNKIIKAFRIGFHPASLFTILPGVVVPWSSSRDYTNAVCASSLCDVSYVLLKLFSLVGGHMEEHIGVGCRPAVGERFVYSLNIDCVGCLDLKRGDLQILPGVTTQVS